MEILRENNSIKLTDDELRAAHKEFVLGYMRSAFQDDFSYSSDRAAELAEIAYQRYSEDNGISITMFEAVEDVAKQDEKEYEVMVAVETRMVVTVKAHNAEVAKSKAFDKLKQMYHGVTGRVNFKVLSAEDENGIITEYED